MRSDIPVILLLMMFIVGLSILDVAFTGNESIILQNNIKLPDMPDFSSDTDDPIWWQGLQDLPVVGAFFSGIDFVQDTLKFVITLIFSGLVILGNILTMNFTFLAGLGIYGYFIRIPLIIIYLLMIMSIVSGTVGSFIKAV